MNTRYEKLINEGKNYLNEKKINLALNCFKEAIEAADSKDNAYIEIGRFFHENGVYDIAKQCFEKALEANSNNDYAKELLTHITINMSESRFFGP